METISKIKNILAAIGDRHLALVNQTGGPRAYRIVEYTRTKTGIVAVQLKAGSVELMLDYAEHLIDA